MSYRCTVLAIEISLASLAFGQEATCAIEGAVVDPAGAPVAAARVFVRETASGQERSSVSASNGAFAFRLLRAGTYEVLIQAAGFANLKVTGIALFLDETRRLELTLQLGAQTEQIQVTASASRLDLDGAALGLTFGGRLVSNLPLNGRNLLQLAVLSPSVVPATTRTADAGRIGQSAAVLHIAGGRANYTSYLLDGQELRGARYGELPLLPSVDAVAEFKVQYNTYSAEFGMNGGIVNLSTKAGSNQFHGSVYWFLRNNALDARQFFDQGGALPFRRNQFGAAGGGPLYPNRTFLFAAYEGERQTRSNTQFANVPTAPFLDGDFQASSVVVHDTLNGGAPFPGKVIPSSRQSVFAAAYRQYIPSATSVTGSATIQGETFERQSADQFHLRLDHHFSAGSTFFSRFSWSDAGSLSRGILPYSGSAFPINSWSVTANHTLVLRPSLVNTLRVGFTRNYIRSSNETSPVDLAASLGLRGLVVAPDEYSVPQVTISGYSVFGHTQNTFRNWTNIYCVGDTLAWERAHHTLTVGFDVRHYRLPATLTNRSNGRLTYSGVVSGSALADYILGAYSLALALRSNTVFDYRSRQAALFFQDNWKLSRRLTVNLGLRWELQSRPDDVGGSDGYFDTSVPALRLAKAPAAYGDLTFYPGIVVGGLGGKLQLASYRNFAPRVGVAVRLDSKTAVRAGAGLYYVQHEQAEGVAISANPGAQVSIAVRNMPAAPYQSTDGLFPLTSPGAPSAMDLVSLTSPLTYWRTPYLAQWHVSAQHEAAPGILAEIGYAGSAGRHLMDRYDINQGRLNLPGENLSIQDRRPFPTFGTVLVYGGVANSSYHSLTVSASGRPSRGPQWLASYTFSKSIDTNSSGNDEVLNHQDSSNRWLEHGPSTFDVGHRLSAAAVYDFPLGKGRQFLSAGNAWREFALGGWQFNAVAAWQTGLPFTVSWISDRSNTGSRGIQRPDRIADGALPPDRRSPARWFDTSVFVPNPIGSFGNSGRNILRQDGVRSVDVSLFKNFPVREGKIVQLRFESFNTLNSHNFDRPGAAIDGPNFGVVTSVGPAREMQVAIKLLW